MKSTVYITEIIPEKSSKDWIAVNTLKWGLVRLMPAQNGFEIAWFDRPDIKFDGRYKPIEGAVFLKEMEAQQSRACVLRLPSNE